MPQAHPPPPPMWALLTKYWTPVFLYCALIIFLSSQSNPSRHLPSFLSDLGDKLAHGIEFGILGILLFRAFHQTTRTAVSISLAIVGAIIFGISDELHQWFVPHRHADLWDVVADSFGAAFFVFLWIFLTTKYRSNR